MELGDGNVWRDTRQYAAPFEPPAWRAQWVEPMEEPYPTVDLGAWVAVAPSGENGGDRCTVVGSIREAT